MSYNVHAGLGDRAQVVATRPRAAKQWSVTSSAPKIKDDITVCVGVITDPQNALRLMDLGPPADNADVAAFRYADQCV